MNKGKEKSYDILDSLPQESLLEGMQHPCNGFFIWWPPFTLARVISLLNCILWFLFYFVGIVYTYDGTKLVSDSCFFLYLALSNPVYASRVVQKRT